MSTKWTLILFGWAILSPHANPWVACGIAVACFTASVFF